MQQSKRHSQDHCLLSDVLFISIAMDFLARIQDRVMLASYVTLASQATCRRKRLIEAEEGILRNSSKVAFTNDLPINVILGRNEHTIVIFNLIKGKHCFWIIIYHSLFVSAYILKLGLGKCLSCNSQVVFSGCIREV